MRRRSSIRISWALIVGLTLLAGTPLLHGANKKKELLKQAQAAEQAGDFEQAETAYCELATQEKKNKTVNAKCAEYTQRNQASRQRDADAIAAGKAALAQHRFQDAIRAFKSVTTAQYRPEATRYLTSVIPDAQKAFEAEQQARERQQRQHDEEARNAQQYKRGVEAYQRNDFDAARLLLTSVTGPNTATAVRLLQQMDAYTKRFQEGLKLERAGNDKQAAAAYRQALKIKADGPGELARKIARLQEHMKAAAASEQAQSAAEAAQAQGLAEGITAFYQGNFADAENKLSNYAGDGSKKALALFYLGASELSRYFLSNAASPPKDLYDSAVEHFHAARQVAPTFAPPQQYVSPRILKVFNDSAS